MAFFHELNVRVTPTCFVIQRVTGAITKKPKHLLVQILRRGWPPWITFIKALNQWAPSINRWPLWIADAGSNGCCYAGLRARCGRGPSPESRGLGAAIFKKKKTQSIRPSLNNGILTLEAWPTEIWVTTGEHCHLFGLLLEIVPRSFFWRWPPFCHFLRH